MKLPQRWTPVKIDGTSVIYGIYSDNLSYSVYATDFEHVWTEVLTIDELVNKARTFGYEDLDPESIANLLQLITKAMHNTSPKFRLTWNIEFTVTLPDFSWTFSLKQQDPAQFLAHLNRQQFLNQDYLIKQIKDLHNIIRIKDVYTKFLLENFKLSHGIDLISNYKHNNKKDTDHLDPFNEAKWLKKFESSYTPESDSLWSAISNVTRDSLWSVSSCTKDTARSPSQDADGFKSSQFYTSPIKLESFEEAQKRKSQRITDSIPNLAPDLQVSLQFITSQFPPSLPVPESQDPIAGSQITISSSPTKKRKRFGDLPSRKRKK